MKLEDAEKLLLQLKSKSSSTRNFFDSRFHLSTVPNSIIPALEKRITTLKASSPNSNPAKTTPPTFITDPTVHIEQDDRYIDKLASVLSNAYGIGNYLITWEKNNEKFLIGIPYRDIFDQKVTPCITEGRVLYTDKSSALKASEDKSKELGNAFRVITYYRHKTKFIDIILPTLFTLNSTPRIYKGIQNLLSDPTDYQQYLTDTGIILKLYKDAIVTVPTGASGVVATAGDIILSQDPDAKAGGSPPMPVKLPSGPIPKPVNKVVHLVQRLIRGTKDIFMESLGGKIRKVHRVGKYEIYETEAGQLMGTHKALTEFRKANPAYNGWDSHHIIEEEHLVSFFKNLVYDDLPCVLLPKVAHANRIRGSVAGKANQLMTEKEVIAMYKNAYEELLDDYTDNGQSSIVSELLSVMLSMMR
jgi:hypothetical protein